MKLKVEHQEWAEPKATVYTLDGVYRGVLLTGLTKNATLAKKVIAGGHGSKKAEQRLSADLKRQNGIYRTN